MEQDKKLFSIRKYSSFGSFRNPDMKQYGCVIPVAGLSTRMGAFKPLLQIDGGTMIEHTLSSVLGAGIDRCVMVLGYHGREIQALIEQYQDPRISFIYNHDFASTDMLYSIKLGLELLQPYQKAGAFVIPGDMPAVSVQTFVTVAKHFERKASLVTFPTYQKRAKHPPLLSADCFEAVLSFVQDGGLRKAIEPYRQRTTYVEVDDYGCCLDADTTDQFEQVCKYAIQN